MKKTVVISEFDPFTNGHAYLAARAKEEGGLLLAVMSGSYTQRGRVAAFDKFARAEAAVEAGFDAVIELPPPFAAATAERFARGAMAVAGKLGAETAVCGAETEDTAILELIAALMLTEPEEVGAQIRAEQKNGVSYPRARAAAVTAYLERHGGPQAARRAQAIFLQPNSMLALEYLKAAAGTGIRVRPVKRVGSAHDGDEDPAFPSAGAIRAALERGEPLPDGAVPPYSREMLARQPFLRHDADDGILLYALRNASESAVRGIADCPREIADRLLANRMAAVSVDDLVARCVSKTHTAARVRRAVVSLALGHTDETFAVCLAEPCAFLLAAADKSVLAALNGSVVSRGGEFAEAGPCMDAILRADALRACAAGTDALSSYKRRLFAK